MLLLALFALLLSACGGLVEASPLPSPSDKTETTYTLWPSTPPHGTGNASYTVFLPSGGTGSGSASGKRGVPSTGWPVLIFTPGGGFTSVADTNDRVLAARGPAQGVACVVLDYRLPQADLPFPGVVSEEDTVRMVRQVRASATLWNVDPHRVTLHGESAGGEMASGVATHWDDGDPTSPDPVERESCRPDRSVLLYPVTQMEGQYEWGQITFLGSEFRTLGAEWTNSLLVSAETPPTAIFWGSDDVTVDPHNSTLYLAALQANGVQNEYVDFPEGIHGLGGVGNTEAEDPPDMKVVEPMMWAWARQ
jgi:acetyl esterase/lipase